MFDNVFNEAIEYELQTCNIPEMFGTPEYYEIRFDENNTPYLYIQSNSGNILLILKNGVSYTQLKGKKVPEGKLLDNIDDLDIQLKKLAMYRASARWFKEPDEVPSIEDQIIENALDICEYIKYLNDIYKESSLTIEFNEPDPVSNGFGVRVKSLIPQQKERKHPELALEERLKVLRNKPYVISADAIGNKNITVYKIFLYNPTENESVIIMEPESGEKQTKIAYLGIKLSEKNLADFVQYYLSLDQNASLEEKTLTRHYHTTLDRFEATIAYATQFIGEAKSDIRQYAKDQIDEAREEGRKKVLHL